MLVALKLIWTDVHWGECQVTHPLVLPSAFSPCVVAGLGLCSAWQWFCPLTVRRSQDSKASCSGSIQLHPWSRHSCTHSSCEILFPAFWLFFLLDLSSLPTLSTAHVSIRVSAAAIPAGCSRCARGVLSDAQEQCHGVRRFVKIWWESSMLITQTGAEQSPVVKIISSQ